MSNLKLNTIYKGSMLNFVYLTKPEENDSSHPIFGKPLFIWNSLFSRRSGIVYENPRHDFRFTEVSDQDIINELVELSMREDINEKTSANITIDGNLYLSGDEQFIWLDKDEALKLKDYLNKYF